MPAGEFLAGLEHNALFAQARIEEILRRIDFIGDPGSGIGNIGKPLDFGWDLGQGVKLRC